MSFEGVNTAARVTSGGLVLTTNVRGSLLPVGVADRAGLYRLGGVFAVRERFASAPGPQLRELTSALALATTVPSALAPL